LNHFLGGLLEIDGDGEEKIGVARGKIAAFAGASRIHHRRVAIEGARESVNSFSFEVFAVPFEWAIVIPDSRDEIEPLLRKLIAVCVFLGQIDAESVVLGLVPAGDDIQA